MPGKKVPFVWFDQTQAVKKLALRMETCDCKLSIDKIHNKEVVAGNDTVSITFNSNHLVLHQCVYYRRGEDR
jgi:hypothetical protein